MLRMIHDIVKKDVDGRTFYYGVFTDKLVPPESECGETMVFHSTPDGDVTDWSALACRRCAPTALAMRKQHKETCTDWGEIVPEYHMEE